MFGKTIDLFLEKDRTDLSLGEYMNRFYTRLNQYGLVYDSNVFDTFLTNLYFYDEKEYKTWMREFHKIVYSFVRSNIDLMNTIVSNKDLDDLKLSFDMYKKAQSIICRSLPTKANYTNVTERKDEILSQFNNMLNDIKANKEDGPVAKAQAEFERCYSFTLENPVLKDYYIKIYSTFGEELAYSVEQEIKKTNEQAVKYSTPNTRYHTNHPIYNRIYK